MNPPQKPWEDPLWDIPRALTKFNSLWLAWTYHFAFLGKNVSFHHSCDLQRSLARYISIGDEVIVAKDAWLDVQDYPDRKEPAIILEDGCGVQRRCTISARNQVHISRNTIFGPNVLVTDHDYTLADDGGCDSEQPIIRGGTICIEEGCWVGYGSAIICEQGELVIGRHSIIGANSVVRRSIPPYSIVSGNPGRIVKQYDPASNRWVLGSREVSVSKR
jgi:acetyltransferase-like isoleucine patch superfamily enzyme